MIYTPHFDSMYPEARFDPVHGWDRGYHRIRANWITSFPDLAAVWNKMKGKQFSLLTLLLDKIHKEKDNTFVFITTPDQEERFNEFVEKFELKDLIVMQTPYVSNMNTGDARRLKVTVIQTKEHFQREEKNSGTGTVE